MQSHDAEYRESGAGWATKPTPPVPTETVTAEQLIHRLLTTSGERLTDADAGRLIAEYAGVVLAARDAEIQQLQEQLAQQQTSELRAQLDDLQRAMAAPLPAAEEIAAGKAEDRAMAEQICRARPGIPLHHAFAVLESLRTIHRLDAAARTTTAQEG